MAKLISINVGLPRDVAWRGGTVHTAIWKQPVQGRRSVRRLNVDGDGQGDLAGHGGEHRAVMVYQQEAYDYWEKHLGRTDFTLGQFGENFTVQGLADDEVSIGDRYRIGSTLLEVTQPRVTCYRLGIRMDQPDMAALLVAHRRPGFYFRVLREGDVDAGDKIVKVHEGPGRMTVAEMDALLYLPGHTTEQLQRALRIPALSAGWKGSFQELADQSAHVVANTAPAWSGFRPMQVSRVDRETASVVSLSLSDPGGAPLPPALPGQFMVLKLHVKPDEPAILRNYSISSAPGSHAYRVSVKKEASGVASRYVHEQVKAGDTLEVSAPVGNFVLRPGKDPLVLISAGIGATPVVAMLHAIRSGTSRQLWWLYAARNRDSHPFARECGELLASIPGARSHVVYSRAEAEDRLGVDYDSAGHLDRALLDRLEIPKDADFYMCGPSSFLQSMTTAVIARGTESSKVHTENFGPDPSLTPGIAAAPEHRAHPPVGVPGAGPLVSFTRSRLTVPWDTRFSNLLEFAEACEVPVRWSCRTGVCHACECALVAGAVAYDPDPLQMPAARNLLICCSRPTGIVDIDL